MKRWIPNVVTLTGALCALLSMIWAPLHSYWACTALIAASLFDMIDGRVARLLDAQSPMGEQLDSLVDIVAFGVAPAYLLYEFAFRSMGTVGEIPVGVVPMFVFVACAALRLARFNLLEQDVRTHFRGIPSPVAALLLVTAVMTSHETQWRIFREHWFLMTLTLVAALLMVSPLNFPSYKSFRTRVGTVLYFGAIGGGLTMLVLGLPGGTVLFGFMCLYVLRGLASALLTTNGDPAARVTAG